MVTSSDIYEKNSASHLVGQLRDTVKLGSYWKDHLDTVDVSQYISFGIHLAVFVEPYLRFILDGKKTVESRFSVNRIAPYEKVRKGDIIILKRSSGPVVGLCEVSDVWFYRLDPKSWNDIKKEFTQSLCAQDPEFWSTRKHASYATLMKVRHVEEIGPIRWTKKDRRGWIVLHNGAAQMRLCKD